MRWTYRSSLCSRLGGPSSCLALFPGVDLLELSERVHDLVAQRLHPLLALAVILPDRGLPLDHPFEVIGRLHGRDRRGRAGGWSRGLLPYISSRGLLPHRLQPLFCLVKAGLDV